MASKLVAFFLILAVASWGAVGCLIVLTAPDLWAWRLAFFLLLFVSLLLSSGLVAYGLSFLLFSSQRHCGNLPQALLVGAPVAFMLSLATWLQSLRLLSWAVALIMLGILGVLEFLLLPRGARQR